MQSRSSASNILRFISPNIRVGASRLIRRRYLRALVTVKQSKTGRLFTEPFSVEDRSEQQQHTHRVEPAMLYKSRWIMEALDDVLKMAKTEEKRELIKWYYARRSFFGDQGKERAFRDGLALARQCLHQDALFLVSLFPSGWLKTNEEAASVFLARRDDPRSLCWGALCAYLGRILEHRDMNDMFRQSGAAGYAWGFYLQWNRYQPRREAFIVARTSV